MRSDDQLGSGSPLVSEIHRNPDMPHSKPGVALVGLLVVQAIVGYEWLISGLAKLVRGGFPAGLANALAEKSEGVPAWYRALMESAFIPNAKAFGYVIEVAELLAGLVLIVGPVLWIVAWNRVAHWVRATVLVSTAVAAIGGAFLAINFHLASGAPQPWLIPRESFDEGVDLDSLLPAIQIVIATVNIILFRRLRRDMVAGSASGLSPSHRRAQ